MLTLLTVLRQERRDLGAAVTVCLPGVLSYNTRHADCINTPTMMLLSSFVVGWQSAQRYQPAKSLQLLNDHAAKHQCDAYKGL